MKMSLAKVQGFLIYGGLKMIDTSAENFTAAEAVETGLIDAIKSGATKVEGTFSLSKDGLKIVQRKFVFKDEYGSLIVGKFVSDDELWKFFEIYAEK